MGIKLRLYVVPLSNAAPEKQPDVVLQSQGDAAKQEARSYIESSGMVVRSINWAPSAGGPDMLIAYAKRKGS